MKLQAQPYRRGARAPSQALDAMLAGGSTPYPGAARQTQGAGAPASRSAGAKTVLVPRVSGRGRNLRRDGR